MTKCIRVLQVFSSMDRGGSETAIMNFYRHINKNIIQFDFLVHTNRKGAYDDEIINLGGRIYNVPRYKLINHSKYMKSCDIFFQNHPEFEIIHGHYYTISAIYFWIAKKYNLTCIAHSHNSSGGKLLKAIYVKLLTIPVRFLADYFFACSELAGRWLYSQQKLKTKKFFIINNAIETNNFTFNKKCRNEKRREFQFDNKFVIGHVGRFHSQKNHNFLIEIFHAIHKMNQNAVLLLIGDGELYQKVVNKVNRLGLQDSVIFTGIRKDIPGLLSAMDIFVLPSLYEGLPVTITEAQANGLKCIISDRVTSDVKITNLIEFVSLKKSPDYWAQQILKYSNGYDRRDTTADIIEAGYNVSENAQMLENLYLQIAETRPKNEFDKSALLADI